MHLQGLSLRIRRSGSLWFGLPLLVALTAPVFAQEPINADAAPMPSPGHVTVREQFRFVRLSLDEGPRDRQSDIDDFQMRTTVNVGLVRDVSLSLRNSVIFRDQSFDRTSRDDREQGVGDVTLLAKWRVWRRDSGPVDTARLALLGGADIRSGDAPFTSDAYNPIVGAAYTQISGRHGFNAALSYTFTTDGAADATYAGMSTADVLRYDAAYLYRLAPSAWSADTKGAWYGMVELNGVYETNGDNEILLSPGLMYEAVTWALELSVQLPVWQDIGFRAETDYTFVIGLRYSF